MVMRCVIRHARTPRFQLSSFSILWRCWEIDSMCLDLIEIGALSVHVSAQIFIFKNDFRRLLRFGQAIEETSI